MSSLIPRPDLQWLFPPYFIDKSRIAAFLLKASAGSVQRLLDSTLNAAATPEGQPLVQRFKPLLGADELILTFIHYPDLRAQQAGVPPASQWGSFCYEEFAVFLLLHDTAAGGLGTCWHVPFIALSEFIPLIVGREVYGMPKVAGTVKADPLLPDDWITKAPSGQLSISVEGFLKPGAGQQAQSVQVAEINLTGPHLAPFDSVIFNPDPLNLIAFAEGLVHPKAFELPILKFFQKMISAGFPGIFLKEFPGNSATGPVASRQLLKAGFTPTAVGSISYVTGEATLFDPASYPLASTFGVTTGQGVSVSGIFAEITWTLPVATPL